MRVVSTDDVEHLPHIVILRTNGKLMRMDEFPNGSEAHKFATKAALDDDAGEIFVCARIRHIESGNHRFRHKSN